MKKYVKPSLSIIHIKPSTIMAASNVEITATLENFEEEENFTGRQDPFADEMFFEDTWD